jgi:DNA mismatch repair protein MutL
MISSLARIRRLPPEVANQIAAGEVIERPANAVKELVENALDAGARRIQIELEDGGKKLIRVRDDGIGMSASDAVLCLQRHATSKLQSADDLWAIQTLGFRGEALPSIAAVSRMELTTRESTAEIGTRLIVEAGQVLDVSELGCASGTEIVVRNLFFNTPARFKFLKSDSAEAGRTTEMIGHLALAHPHVSFSLKHNGNESLRVEAGGDAFNALVCVLGREVARQMLPIPEIVDENSNIRVTGFAGRPQLTRANRNGQIFYVNNRVVKSRAIQHAVQAAYEGLLHGHGRFPLAVLFISIPPNAVDVNVHPTKSEVRFAREWEVHHAARVATRDALIASQLTPNWGFAEAGDRRLEAGGNHAPTFQPPGSRFQPPSRPVAPRGGDLSAFRAAYQNAGSFNENFSSASTPFLEPRTSNLEPDQSTLPASEPEGKLRLRPLGQIQNNAYILCEGEDGLYIVSQHRAHERVLADKALAEAEGKPVESQRLVIPLTVEVGVRALAALEENSELLKNLGFEIEAFGGASVLVRAVPSLVAHGDYEVAFADLLEELISGMAGRDLHERRRKLLTMLSCKNAIKAGDPLRPEEISGLLEDLLQVPNPSICPHGQPILIKISTWELNKKFEREYASR